MAGHPEGPHSRTCWAPPHGRWGWWGREVRPRPTVHPAEGRGCPQERVGCRTLWGTGLTGESGTPTLRAGRQQTYSARAPMWTGTLTTTSPRCPSPVPPLPSHPQSQEKLRQRPLEYLSLHRWVGGSQAPTGTRQPGGSALRQLQASLCPHKQLRAPAQPPRQMPPGASRCSLVSRKKQTQLSMLGGGHRRGPRPPARAGPASAGHVQRRHYPESWTETLAAPGNSSPGGARPDRGPLTGLSSHQPAGTTLRSRPRSDSDCLGDTELKGQGVGGGGGRQERQTLEPPRRVQTRP